MNGSFTLFRRPEFILAFAALFLGVCFAAVYKGAKLFNISKQDMAKNGSLKKLALSIWGSTLFALAAFILVTNYTDFTIELLRSIGNLYKEENPSEYLPEIICAIIGDLLYTLFLLPCWFAFKKAIAGKEKRKKLFLLTLAVLPSLWIALMAMLIFLI